MRMHPWGGKSMVRTLLLMSITFLLCKTTLGSYSISTYLHQFLNPGQKLFNGTACDRDTRNDQCEHQFRICLDYSKGNQYNHVQCRVKGPFTQNLKKWTVTRVEQPWQGEILMKVYVSDKDKDKSEFVDNLSQVIKFDACRSFDQTRDQYDTLTMNGTHTSLTLELVVYCNRNWKGPHCGCDDTKQNYYCEHDGNKTCNSGWYGPQCDVECTPANGMNEHYECSPNGTKYCHDDYYGEDCDKYCKSTDDGHYTCDQNGNTICSKNWCSENCDVFCEEVHTVPTDIDQGMLSSTRDGTDPDPQSSDEEIGSKTNEGNPNLIPIIGGVAGAMALLIIGLTVFFCKRKKRHQGAETDTTPMQIMTTSEGHANNSRMNDGFYPIATPVGPGYEDCFPNLAARKPQAGATGSTSNDVYAVPHKKRKTQAQGDLVDVSDDMLIVENELYGVASQEKETQAHAAGGAGDISDDMLIVDNELYGPTSEVKGTQSHKVGAAANISDDMLIVDNELYGQNS